MQNQGQRPGAGVPGRAGCGRAARLLHVSALQTRRRVGPRALPLDSFPARGQPSESELARAGTRVEGTSRPVLGGGATCLGVRRAVTEEQEESRGEPCGAERRSGTPGADAYVAGRHGQVGRSGGLAACADGCLADGRLKPRGVGLACDPGVPSSQAWLLPTVAESCAGRSSPSAVTSREGPPSTPLKTKCTLWATKVSARLRGLHELGKIPSILRN